MIRVSAVSRPAAVAGSIAKTLRETPTLEVRAVGAGAVNQMVKAIAIAFEYLENDVSGITCVPVLVKIDIEGHERTGVCFTIRRIEE